MIIFAMAALALCNPLAEYVGIVMEINQMPTFLLLFLMQHAKTPTLRHYWCIKHVFTHMIGFTTFTQHKE